MNSFITLRVARSEPAQRRAGADGLRTVRLHEELESMPYNPWRRHLAELARELGFPHVEEVELPMEGRARVVLGDFTSSASGG